MKSEPEKFNNLSSINPFEDHVTSNIRAVLGAVAHLPLPFWKEAMLFRGARDRDLTQLTEGKFPLKPRSKGTHPVFALKALPAGAGFKVCPCSTRKPFDVKASRFIDKGCRLRYTGNVMDKTSYLVETIHFNIPASVARRVRFMGEVPPKCIKKTGSGEK